MNNERFDNELELDERGTEDRPDSRRYRLSTDAPAETCDVASYTD